MIGETADEIRLGDRFREVAHIVEGADPGCAEVDAVVDSSASGRMAFASRSAPFRARRERRDRHAIRLVIGSLTFVLLATSCGDGIAHGSRSGGFLDCDAGYTEVRDPFGGIGHCAPTPPVAHGRWVTVDSMDPILWCDPGFDAVDQWEPEHARCESLVPR